MSSVVPLGSPLNPAELVDALGPGAPRPARIPYRVPEEAELPDRLPSVLAVLYLIYSASADGASGDELRAEAIRLVPRHPG